MKAFVLALVICFSALFKEVHGQVKKKDIPYQSWLSTLDESYKFKGYLFELKPSEVVMSYNLPNKDYNIEPMLVSFNIADISTLKFRKEGNVGKGAWIGSLAGFTIGLVLGIVVNSSMNEAWGTEGGYESSLVVGFQVALYGAGIGAAIGSAKIRFSINGRKENYHPEDLRQYITNTKNED